MAIIKSLVGVTFAIGFGINAILRGEESYSTGSWIYLIVIGILTIAVAIKMWRYGD